MRGRPRLVECWCVSSLVDETGLSVDSTTWTPELLAPERAHELATAPRVAVQEAAVWGRVVVQWRVAALGFILEEALEAHDEAVERLLADPDRFTRRWRDPRGEAVPLGRLA